MALQNTISLQDAFSRGHQHWKAILSNWGNRGTGTDAASLIYDVGRPVVGCQIASDSDVAEALIMFDGGVGFPRETPYGFEDDKMYVRRGRPYFWRTPATIAIVPTFDTIYGDVFETAVPAQATTFGGALANWTAPTLRIILFFENTPNIQAEPAWPYAPDFRTFTFVTNAEQFDGRSVWPIQHRDRIRITGRIWGASADIPYELRVCGVTGRRGLGAGDDDLWEESLLSTPLILAPHPTIGTVRNFSVPIAHPRSTWLTVYPQTQVAAAGNVALRILGD
jgi:hypothetical protein